MQNSRLIKACFPIKIDEGWIDQFCVHYDWWRRLQPTSSVSPVWNIFFYFSIGTQRRIVLAFTYVFQIEMLISIFVSVFVVFCSVATWITYVYHEGFQVLRHKLCVPEMFVTSYSVTYCIYVPEKPWICFHYYCAVYDERKYSDTCWLADRFRLFVQYTISLSSLCKLIWRHWTYKMLVRYIWSSVWVRLSIFSLLSIIQYVGLYVFSLPISLVVIERIYILCVIIIIKSEVWTITHCLGL